MRPSDQRSARTVRRMSAVLWFLAGLLFGTVLARKFFR